VERLKTDDGKIITLLTGIVESAPFTRKRIEESDRSKIAKAR